jgi:hypothetical protein
MILLFANNAGSTLASGLPASGAGSTTIVLATGTGALFPSPSTGQAFKVTLVDAATQTLNEICLCTSRTSDTLTVLRAQEGTTALGWAVGDLCSNFNTAGAQAAAVQADQLQLGSYDLVAVGGTVNAITATLPSNLTALVNGMKVRFLASGVNTNAMTLNLTLGATATGAISILVADTSITGNFSLATAGTVPCAGYPIELTYASGLAGTGVGWVLTPIAPQNLMPRAWAIFTAGTLSWGANIATWAKSATGVYNFTFTSPLTSATGSQPWGINFGPDASIAEAGASASNQTHLGGTINGFNTTTGVALDINGCITIWGP